MKVIDIVYTYLYYVRWSGMNDHYSYKYCHILKVNSKVRHADGTKGVKYKTRLLMVSVHQSTQILYYKVIHLKFI